MLTVVGPGVLGYRILTMSDELWESGKAPEPRPAAAIAADRSPEWFKEGNFGRRGPGVGRTGHYLNPRTELEDGVLELLKAYRLELQDA